MESKLLVIENLCAAVQGKEILKGVNLTINRGEIHALMGPNGAGKSTLSAVLAGHPNYEVTAGSVYLKGKDLLAMPPEERAWEGLFLSFQYPVEISGVSMVNFLKVAINQKRIYNNEPQLPIRQFLKELKENKGLLEMDEKLEGRSINEGFSGGEKKKNEILQMAMLQPCMSILDELDSGLDIDALRVVATGVNSLKNDQNAFLLITHYQRLLNYIVPDFVHILEDGRIVKTGTKDLALQLEYSGYRHIE